MAYIPIYLLQKLFRSHSQLRISAFRIISTWALLCLNTLNAKRGYLTAVLSVQFIQFNLNMSIDYESISVFLAQDCKDSFKKLDGKCLNDLNHQGRWTQQEWTLYVLFSLKQFCKCKQTNEFMGSFTRNRRTYSSFDKRFVEFLIERLKIENLSSVQKQAMIKRAKSKFGTLKRRFKTRSSSRYAQVLKFPDLVEYIYKEAASKLKQNPKSMFLSEQLKKELENEIERFEQQCKLNNESNNRKLEEVTPSRRYKNISSIKTRSLTCKKKQIGTTQN